MSITTKERSFSWIRPDVYPLTITMINILFKRNECSCNHPKTRGIICHPPRWSNWASLLDWVYFSRQLQAHHGMLSIPRRTSSSNIEPLESCHTQRFTVSLGNCRSYKEQIRIHVCLTLSKINFGLQIRCIEMLSWWQGSKFVQPP